MLPSFFIFPNGRCIYMTSKLSKKAFSMIELAVALIVIAVLAAGIMSGKRAIDNTKLKAAQILTKSSPIYSIPDLTMWLEPTLEGSIIGASNSADILDGEKVVSWTGISERKITLSQGTTLNQPTYVRSGINGLPSLQFQRANSQRLFSSNTPISEGNDGYTIIAVFKADTTNGGYVFANTGTSRQASILYVTGGACCFGGHANDSQPVSIQNNGNYVVVVKVDNSLASNITTYINGGLPTFSATPAPAILNVGAQTVMIGTRTGSVFSHEGLISEVIIFDRALKDHEISIVNSYLIKKYNIS